MKWLLYQFSPFNFCHHPSSSDPCTLSPKHYKLVGRLTSKPPKLMAWDNNHYFIQNSKIKQFVLGSAGQFLLPQPGSLMLLLSVAPSPAGGLSYWCNSIPQFLILSCRSRVAGKTVWRFLTKLNRLLPCDPAVMLQRLGNSCHTETYTQLFIVALYIIATTLKEPRLLFSR